MTNCELVMTVKEMETSNDNWLKLRKAGIGGSDAAAILGMTPWKSPYQLWLEKTGEVEAEDISTKEVVHFGHVLEQVVADEFCQRADSANKLEGVPLSHGGDSTFGKIPLVGDGGVLEIGKYINFHSKNGDKKDYSTRIEANDDGTISVSGGVNANLHGNASSASSVPWTGVTGKPSTYPPSGHNHDSAYPAINGSRATGTWGINITGSSASCTGNAKTASSCTGNSSTANTAGKIGEGGNTNNPITFHWSGQSGQPTWMWGSNDRANQYVYNPSNFRVSYANSAGSANAVAWGNVSSKPASIVKVASWDGSTLNLTTCT